MLKRPFVLLVLIVGIAWLVPVIGCAYLASRISDLEDTTYDLRTDLEEARAAGDDTELEVGRLKDDVSMLNDQVSDLDGRIDSLEYR